VIVNDGQRSASAKKLDVCGTSYGKGVNKIRATGRPKKAVYKITYPNGKIYVGLDLTGTMLYFGSPSADIAADFTEEERRDVTIRKQILWEEELGAAEAAARAMEVTLIRQLRSNDPTIGYNRWPKHKP
jgi:hypothetical protein